MLSVVAFTRTSQIYVTIQIFRVLIELKLGGNEINYVAKLFFFLLLRSLKKRKFSNLVTIYKFVFLDNFRMYIIVMN